MLVYIRMRGRGIHVTGSHGRGVQWVIRLCGVWLKLHWLDRTQPTPPPCIVLCSSVRHGVVQRVLHSAVALPVASCHHHGKHVCQMKGMEPALSALECCRGPCAWLELTAAEPAQVNTSEQHGAHAQAPSGPCASSQLRLCHLQS